MKTATVNFKTDDVTKRKAQQVAKQIGIPLSSLLNAYLTEVATTGTVHFTASEPMSAKTEQLIGEIEADIAAGENLSGPFDTLEDLFAYLDSLPHDDSDN